MKTCGNCGKTKGLGEFNAHANQPDGCQHWCKVCHREDTSKRNPSSNPERMYVGGVYQPKTHPRYKPGRYKTWDHVAWNIQQEGPPTKDGSGEVYIITNPAYPAWVKVGLASESAEDRLRSYQTGDPFRSYQLDYSWRVGDCRAAEKSAHAILSAEYKRKNEWFQCGVEQARLLIEGTMEEYA